MSNTRLAGRRRGLFAVGTAAALLLTGCGGAESGEQPDASSSARTSAAGESTDAPTKSDLAAGLLGAEDFDPGTAVTALSAEQLRQGGALAGGVATDTQVMPEACRGAVEGTAPQLGDFDDVAAVSATSGEAVTIEMLVRGGPTDGAVAQLIDAVVTCPEAQVTSPQIGSATVAFTLLEVDDLGDGSAAVQYTTTVTQPDGAVLSVPALIGAVQDGDRLLVLVSFAQSGVPDAAAFTDLLAQAYQVQADALG